MTITAKKYAYLIDEHRARSNDQIAQILDEISGKNNENKVVVAPLLHEQK